MANFDDILLEELKDLEGIQTQNPETGAGVNSGKSYVKNYTNRIFGAPYQLIPSVDYRFKKVNTNVGNEYLRHFILNSPILHIKPGMPIYTGGGDSNSILKQIKKVYIGTNKMTFTQSLLTELASSTIFSNGSKLQKRMFGFRETYYQYMSHVNYMCRSMAVFLNLTSNAYLPKGVFINVKKGKQQWCAFKNMKWENYRMLANSYCKSPTEELKALGSATMIGVAGTTVNAVYKELKKGITSKNKKGKKTTNKKKAASAAATAIASSTGGGDNDDVFGALSNSLNNISEKTQKAMAKASQTSLVDVTVDKVCSVMFMVEPTQFEESLTNTTKDSAIESALDAVTSGIGSELAFITNSKVDLGLIGGITDFLGDSVNTAASFISGLVEPITGGFTSNLFQGALKTVKGQKMIYPKIYDKSESKQDYQFTIRLSSPYGDIYNYYMNIVVPLMHLIALAAPRMITSNAVQSPYLVQAFIPGQCTCQLGIISQMTITKNAENGKHISVNGYPLDVKVTFTIEELYNALSISPSNDPASFLFNETLNDYMANLAGLQPSVNTYTNQRLAAFNALENYFKDGEYLEDVANSVLTSIENKINPFT